MIHSSFLPYDEASVWEPKRIRHYLYISEDQLNVLCNIPEWSQKNNSDALRLESGILCATASSQSSITSKVDELTGVSKQKNFTPNLEYIDHKIQSEDPKSAIHSEQKLESISSKTRKRSNSFSFETNIILDPLKNNSLTRILSAPDISKKAIYLRVTSHLLNQCLKSNEKDIAVLDKPYSEAFITYSEKKSILSKEVNKGKNLSVNLFNSPEKSKTGESIDKISNPMIMEVVTQLPTTVPIHPVNNEAELENMKNKAQEHISVIDNNKVSEVDSICNNGHISVSSAHESSLKHDSNVSEKNANEPIIPVPLISDNKAMSDVPCIKETDSENSKISNGDLKVDLNEKEMNKEANGFAESFQKLDSDISKELPESSKLINEEQCALKVNETSNKLCNTIADSYNPSNVEIHSQNKVPSEEGHNVPLDKSLSSETVVPAKRKSESKSRNSSKKRKHTREKQGQAETRNRKKAGEICYTVEEIKCMLGIMKQFL